VWLAAESEAMHAVGGGHLSPASPMLCHVSTSCSSTWRMPRSTVSSPEFSDSKDEEDMDIDPDENSPRADSVLQLSPASLARNRSVTPFLLSDLCISEQYCKPATSCVKRESSKCTRSINFLSSEITSQSSVYSASLAKQSPYALTYESSESDCNLSNLSYVTKVSSSNVTRKDELSLAQLNEGQSISLSHGTVKSASLPQGQHKLGSRTLLFCVTFLMIVVAIFAGVYHLPATHCVDSIDLRSLHHELEHRVHGQHIAVNVVIKRLEEFTTASNKRLLVMSFHGWTGIGKNFMSSIIAQYLPPTNIHKFIVPLHFASDTDSHASLLSDWFMSNVSSPSCGLHLFIVDEIDKAHDSLVHSLRESLTQLSAKSDLSCRAILLLLTNDGASEINTAITKVLTTGGSRQDLELADLIPVVNSQWYTELVSAKLIDQVVPFLPLERQHVAQCTEAELKVRRVHVTQQLVDDIVNSLSYFPADISLFSSSGCRRITHLVDLFL